MKKWKPSMDIDHGPKVLQLEYFKYSCKFYKNRKNHITSLPRLSQGLGRGPVTEESRSFCFTSFRINLVFSACQHRGGRQSPGFNILFVYWKGTNTFGMTLYPSLAHYLNFVKFKTEGGHNPATGRLGPGWQTRCVGWHRSPTFSLNELLAL